MSSVPMAPWAFFQPLSSHLAYTEFSKYCEQWGTAKTVPKPLWILPSLSTLSMTFSSGNSAPLTPPLLSLGVTSHFKVCFLSLFWSPFLPLMFNLGSFFISFWTFDTNYNYFIYVLLCLLNYFSPPVKYKLHKGRKKIWLVYCSIYSWHLAENLFIEEPVNEWKNELILKSELYYYDLRYLPGGFKGQVRTRTQDS